MSENFPSLLLSVLQRKRIHLLDTSFCFLNWRKQSWPGLSSSKNSPNTSLPYHTTCLSAFFNFPMAAQGRTLQVWELGIQKSKTSSQEKAAFHWKASNKSSSDCLIKPLAEFARPPFMFCEGSCETIVTMRWWKVNLTVSLGKEVVRKHLTPITSCRYPIMGYLHDKHGQLSAGQHCTPSTHWRAMLATLNSADWQYLKKHCLCTRRSADSHCLGREVWMGSLIASPLLYLMPCSSMSCTSADTAYAFLDNQIKNNQSLTLKKKLHREFKCDNKSE